jgi:hypothetical protein
MSPQDTAATADSSTGTGRVAVVTGRSRGIGRAVAVQDDVVGTADADPLTEEGFHP